MLPKGYAEKYSPLCYTEEIMLNFYTVKMKYVRNLMNIDHKNVMSVSSQHRKNKRIFVGIIVMIDKHKYCIPLSSVEEKTKYQNMSNNITFRKITDDSGKVIGVLNINNMIPVREEYLLPFDLKITPSDDEKQRRYKEHCMQELVWCRVHEEEITMLARELHRMVCTNQPFKKRSICPDYKLLEYECDKAKRI